MMMDMMENSRTQRRGGQAGPAVAPSSGQEKPAEPAARAQYQFPQYSGDSTASNDPPFKGGVRPAGWSFMWELVRKIREAEQKYWQVVRRDTHIQWFDAGAFDPDTGMIVQGRLNAGQPEKCLLVRPTEASEAEAAALAAAVGAKLRASKRPVVRGADKEGVSVVTADAPSRQGTWDEVMPSGS